LERKLRNKEPLQNAFDVVVCGDDPGLRHGKPAPDCFLKVATLLNVSPAECLVIEDSRSGVQAALAADMQVVYVPSLRGICGIPEEVVGSSGDKAAMVKTIYSLLDFEPLHYNLTPFPGSSRIHGTVPLEHVWRVQGKVVVGFGRGSKQLGIPTANIDPEAVSKVISGSSSGVFFGWSLIEDFGDGQVYPFCSSIGWNPVFKNANKTCEPWILHDFGGESFVGKVIRLIICGYIRPESDFASLDALIERIHMDAEVTKQALRHPNYSCFKTDPFLLSSPRNQVGRIPVSTQTK
jgi:riboflavin kinase